MPLVHRHVHGRCPVVEMGLAEDPTALENVIVGVFDDSSHLSTRCEISRLNLESGTSGEERRGVFGHAETDRVSVVYLDGQYRAGTEEIGCLQPCENICYGETPRFHKQGRRI